MNKKLLLSLGAIGSIAAPVAAVVACGNSNNPTGATIKAGVYHRSNTPEGKKLIEDVFGKVHNTYERDKNGNLLPDTNSVLSGKIESFKFETLNGDLNKVLEDGIKENKLLKNRLEKYKRGEITPDQLEKISNNPDYSGRATIDIKLTIKVKAGKEIKLTHIKYKNGVESGFEDVVTWKSGETHTILFKTTAKPRPDGTNPNGIYLDNETTKTFDSTRADDNPLFNIELYYITTLMGKKYTEENVNLNYEINKIRDVNRKKKLDEEYKHNQQNQATK